MHTAIQAIFDEHAEPTRCCTKDVRSGQAPTLKVSAQVQAQIVEYRMLLLAAEAADDLPDEFRGKIEMFNQTLAAAERLSAASIENGRELGKAMGQLDRYMDEAKKSIAAWYEKQAKAALNVGGK